MSKPYLRKYFGIPLLAVLLVLAAVLVSLAGDAALPINKDEYGVAIKGYDAVAYFTEGRAVKGNLAYEYVWQDARWLFASADHRDMFASSPERYAPQYGGFCSTAMAADMFAGVDPEAFKIIDGRLYLNYNQSTSAQFSMHAAENIQKADTNWSKKTKPVE